MSVTAVPIQPLKKGSLTKYWAAIALVLAMGGGLAYWGTSDVRQEFGDVVTTSSGLRYKIIEAGEGPNPTDNDVVLVSYKGMLMDGTVFDQNPQAGFPVTGVVPGFSEGLKIMQRGGKYRLSWLWTGGSAQPANGRSRHSRGKRTDLRCRAARIQVARRN
jgi:hypothetical protein